MKQHDIIIEKGITIPSKLTCMDKIKQMDIGDSFLIKPESVSYIRLLLHKLNKTTDMSFFTRKTDKGVRAWRDK